jgi:multiple sugar transport system permease protein
MTLGLVYAIGTIAAWAGWIYAFRAVYALFQIVLNSPGTDRDKLVRGVGIWGLVGAVGIGVGTLLPGLRGDKEPGAVELPLFWFVMPYSAWLAVLCGGFLIVRLVQAGFAINVEERRNRIVAAGLWALALGVFLGLFFRDPENKLQVLRGAIPFTFERAAVLILAILAAMGAMVAAARATRSRGIAKAIVNQVALIAGSIVFGIPFLFLVVTSFKEDRDMSSPNGIVWIPRVQDTVPYRDPKLPYFEASKDGDPIRGFVTEELPDGNVKLDIVEPLAIRGTTFVGAKSSLRQIDREAPVFSGTWDGVKFTGMEVERLENGGSRIRAISPDSLKGKEKTFDPGELEPVRHVGLLTKNYPDALAYMPPETNTGLVYLKNTLILVILSVVGTLMSSSIVAYAFSRMKFPGRDFLFGLLLATMMIPGAVTLLPQFLIFRSFGWIDTLYPLWVPAFFASAFNVFLLRQFFKGIPMELEDAAKIDGCSYFRAFWSIMLPQIKPALAVIAIWTVLGAWNNFMGPLIYVNSPENMPISYALQLFQSDRGGEPGYLTAFTTLTIIPVLALFFFAQKYFIEGVTLSGMGGR